MCGIFGALHLNGEPVDPQAVYRATNLLKHRGPDDEGYLFGYTQSAEVLHCGGRDTDPRLALPHIDTLGETRFQMALGFRRLKIIDLSPNAHQPMVSANGRFWLVYNGEVYNYLELRAELEALGHVFKTASDSEVILAAYDQWGRASFSRLNGMWAFAIWDNYRRELVLSRDRFGIKPLYYTWQGQKFTFASEIKALAGGLPTGFHPNQKTLHLYLSRKRMPDASSMETFFEEVQCLAPGFTLTVSASGLEMHRYWKLPEREDNATQPLDEAVNDFSNLLTDAIRIALRSDVPLGSCLSGGLDSSAIVATIHRLLAQGAPAGETAVAKLRTFSAVYPYEGPYNEIRYIEKLAKLVPAEFNYTYPDAGTLAADINRLVWAQDEPFPSTSIFAQWSVMKLARQHEVVVLLDGQGVDEMMGGYRPFSRYMADLLRHQSLLTSARAAMDIFRSARLKTLYHMGAAIAYSSPLLNPLGYTLQDYINKDTVSIQPEFENQARKLYAGAPLPLHRSLDEHLRHLFEETNLPNLLRYEDRNSMAFSIEARVPYLDYRLVEMVFSRLQTWHIHKGWTKYILRRAMQDQLPGEIAWRRDKVGFATPEAHWLREWMRTSLDDIFNDHSLCTPYLDLHSVRSRISTWLKFGGYMPPVWRWINLEIWLRVWKEAAVL